MTNGSLTSKMAVQRCENQTVNEKQADERKSAAEI